MAGFEVSTENRDALERRCLVHEAGHVDRGDNAGAARQVSKRRLDIRLPKSDDGRKARRRHGGDGRVG